VFLASLPRSERPVYKQCGFVKQKKIQMAPHSVFDITKQLNLIKYSHL